MSGAAAPSAEPKAAAQQPSEADKRAWAKRAKPKPKPKPEPEKPKPEKPKPGVFDDRL